MSSSYHPYPHPHPHRNIPCEDEIEVVQDDEEKCDEVNQEEARMVLELPQNLYCRKVARRLLIVRTCVGIRRVCVCVK